MLSRLFQFPAEFCESHDHRGKNDSAEIERVKISLIQVCVDSETINPGEECAIVM
jgi:hypothetical protein